MSVNVSYDGALTIYFSVNEFAKSTEDALTNLLHESGISNIMVEFNNGRKIEIQHDHIEVQLNEINITEYSQETDK